MKAVRDLMYGAVREGVFPGAVLLVADKAKTVFFEAFGRARLAPERPMTIDTVFDLASLTKPLATTVSLMLLVQQETLNLNQKLGTLIPRFSGTDKKECTIRQLLCHTSGLPDYKPYYKELVKLPPSKRKSTLKERLIAEPLINEPGQVCLYSDLGFMILQWIIEDVGKERLDCFVRKSVYEPLGLQNLFFNPLPQINNHPYAATEDCPWRGRVLEGEVHDDNAHAIGGVAGHSGLFGMAQGVFRLLAELLNTYLGKANIGLFHQGVVRTFFEQRSGLGSWALGFDTPTQPGSSSGKHFSNHSVGHLGFTGSSFWVDLEEETVVILLANRIHPTRQNEQMNLFRPVLHDAVMETIRP